MTAEQSCPKCSSTYVYMDGAMWICPECAYEWSPFEQEAAAAAELESTLVRDANGVILSDGDSVVVIKDLKIKGSSSSIKGGTKVKGIRLHDAGDGHNISGKIDGFGSMNLKSEFVKKS